MAAVKWGMEGGLTDGIGSLNKAIKWGSLFFLKKHTINVEKPTGVVG